MRVLVLTASILLSGCEARVPVAHAYGECDNDQDCEDAAQCQAPMLFSVCRPSCAQDDDCPPAESATVSCRDEGERAGQCMVVPEDRSCPAGMVILASDASPNSPMMCAWES